MCGARTSCKVAAVTDAGKDGDGRSLAVVELHFGLADKPQDAPDEGCIVQDGSYDGGQEYWLLRDGQAPRRLLALCNDGYGAAGVGSDQVTVAPNRLIHEQLGGSNWRWKATVIYRLSPFRELTERNCSFNTLVPKSGTILDLDLQRLRARAATWAVPDSKAQSQGSQGADQEDAAMGCPDWPPSLDRNFTPQPTPDVVAAYVVPAPLASGAAPLPEGSALGDCAMALATDGSRGFLIFGKPADKPSAAEVRAIAEGYNSLVLQVFDPAAAAGLASSSARSWIHAPHLEVWTAIQGTSEEGMPSQDFVQIGVGLDGTVHPAVGNPDEVPQVTHWPARDERGRDVIVLRLHWADNDALLPGVGVVYSQAEQGKQARLVSNVGIVRNRPLFLPEIWQRETEDEGGAHCGLKNGLLAILR